MSNQPEQSLSKVPTDDENQGFQFHKLVEELKRFNEALLAENEMFEQFIIRSEQQNQDSSVDPQRDERLQKGSGCSTPSRTRQLTTEQKLYVVQAAIKEAQKDLEKLRENNIKTWDDYESSMEEAELCRAEIQKAKCEFEQKLLRHKNEKRLQMKEPEKLLLYITDKPKVTKIKVLSRKNIVLQGLRNKLKHDFQQKKENRKIHYEKSPLSQDSGGQKIEKTLEELLDEYIKTQHLVTVHEEKLKSVTTEHTKMCQKIEKRVRFLAKTENNIKQAEKERLKEENLNRHLRSQMETYEVPDVKVYQEARRKYKRLQQEIRTVERKVRIVQMTSKISTKARSSQKAPVSVGGPKM